MGQRQSANSISLPLRDKWHKCPLPAPLLSLPSLSISSGPASVSISLGHFHSS